MNSYIPIDDTDQTLVDRATVQTPTKTWRPIRGILNIDPTIDQLRRLQRVVTPPTPAGQVAVVPGVPGNLFSIFATQSPVKQQDRTYSEVSVQFNVIPSASYANTRIWIQGYKGNPNPVLQTAGASGPINFLLEATHEAITIIGQPVAQDGSVIDMSKCLSTTVILSGVVTAPPAPTISQTLVAIPLGYQFAYNQLNLGATQDVIDSYKVYRNTSNTPGGTLLRVIKHDPTATGAVVVQDTTGGNQTFYYFVSAVNTVGLESTLTNAQTGAVTSGQANPAVGDIAPKGSLPPSIVGQMAYTQTPDTGGSVGKINLFWDGTNGSEAIVLYRMDGTTTSVPTSNTSITGLAAGTYFVYPYWDDVNQQIFFVSNVSTPAIGGGVGTNATYGSCLYTSKTYAQAQAQTNEGHIPLSTGGISVTVLTAGGGGGGGFGGGGSKCVIEGTKVRTRRYDAVVSAEDVRVGDKLWGPKGWETVVEHQVIPFSTFLRFTLSNGESVAVTPNHIFTLPGERSCRADRVCFNDVLLVEHGMATIRKIEVVEGKNKVAITCEPTHLFYAGDSSPTILVHNILPC